MELKEAYEVLSGYAESKQMVLLELCDGQKIYCYPRNLSEADLDDLGFNFKIAPESKDMPWLLGGKWFSTPFSTILSITPV